MPNYMTFLFDVSALQQLLDAGPDYVLVNVGSKIINDPDDPKNQLAALTVNAQGFKDGAAVTAPPVAQVPGCPVPPCRPGG